MGNDSPHFPPQKIRIWEDLGGQRLAASPFLQLWSGRSEGKKGRVGEKRPARPLDNGLVAPARMARQGGPRHRVATLSGRQGICRASGVGATSLLCRAIVCPSPVRTAFFIWWHGRSFWSRHSQWRDKHRIRTEATLLLCLPSAAGACFCCSLAASCFCCRCSSC